MLFLLGTRRWFIEQWYDTRMRRGEVVGKVTGKCYIGSCTLRGTLMDAKKKEDKESSTALAQHTGTANVVTPTHNLFRRLL
jgi:hypothetical protein